MTTPTVGMLIEKISRNVELYEVIAIVGERCTIKNVKTGDERSIGIKTATTNYSEYFA